MSRTEGEVVGKACRVMGSKGRETGQEDTPCLLQA
jgi:hypothetical protein